MVQALFSPPRCIEVSGLADQSCFMSKWLACLALPYLWWVEVRWVSNLKFHVRVTCFTDSSTTQTPSCSFNSSISILKNSWKRLIINFSTTQTKLRNGPDSSIWVLIILEKTNWLKKTYFKRAFSIVFAKVYFSKWYFSKRYFQNSKVYFPERYNSSHMPAARS